MWSRLIVLLLILLNVQLVWLKHRVALSILFYFHVSVFHIHFLPVFERGFNGRMHRTRATLNKHDSDGVFSVRFWHAFGFDVRMSVHMCGFVAQRRKLLFWTLKCTLFHNRRRFLRSEFCIRNEWPMIHRNHDCFLAEFFMELFTV